MCWRRVTGYRPSRGLHRLPSGFAFGKRVATADEVAKAIAELDELYDRIALLVQAQSVLRSEKRTRTNSHPLAGKSRAHIRALRVY
jgi:hypothetical protein